MIIKNISIFQPIYQPSIELFGIKVLEPITSVTDIALSIACFYYTYKLFQLQTPKSHLYYLSLLYFFLMACATLYGGIIGHALIYLFPFSWKLPGWITGMLSIMCLERWVIFRLKDKIPTNLFQLMNLLNILEFIGLTSLTIYTLNFYIVEAHGTYGILLITGGLELWNYLKTNSEISAKILRGVILSIITAIIHLTRFSIDEWLNYLDISHLLMIITAYWFYIGMKSQLLHQFNKR